MKVGVKAAVTLQEFPGQKFIGTIARTADAIDPATRTLNTEVDVPNKDGKLLPGSFGQVHFATGNFGSKNHDSGERDAVPRRGAAGLPSWTKTAKCTLRPINIGRDFGATLEILGGIDASDQIIINPSDSLEEGQKVRVAKPKPGRRALVKHFPAAGSRKNRSRTRHVGSSLPWRVSCRICTVGCTVGPGYKRPSRASSRHVEG